MDDIIVVLGLLALVAAIVWYLVRAKRRGEACVGCPYAKQCSGGCGGCGDGSHTGAPQDKTE